MTTKNHTPTQEQAAIIDAARHGEDLKVTALAGTGKTSTIAMMSAALRPRRILYTAFNRKIIEDARSRLSDNVSIKTNHQLAWGVGARYKDAGKLSDRFNIMLVMERMRWTRETFGGHLDPLAGTAAAVAAVNRYCGSGDETLGVRHSLLPRAAAALKPSWEGEARQAIAKAATRLWNRMRDLNDRDIPATHDTYLKVWCLSRPRLNYETIIIDEAQDTSGAMIGLLEDQTHAQRIIVGDAHQAIYGFRGAISAMQRMDAANECTLTESFRFGPTIAAAANAVLAHYVGSKLRLRGYEKITSRVGPVSEPRCIIARTNAALVGEVFRTVAEDSGEVIAVVGGVKDLIRLVEGAFDLRAGRRTNCPDLYGIESFEDLILLSETEGGEEFKKLVELVMTYPPHQLIASLTRIDGNEKREDFATRILTTAHRAKGREWDTVRLADDFKVPKIGEGKGSSKRAEIDAEEANLLYVAMTRARLQLDVEACGSAQLAMALAGLPTSSPMAAALLGAPLSPPAAAVPGPEAPAALPAPLPADGFLPPGPRSQHRSAPGSSTSVMPSHWVLDTSTLPPEVRVRLEAMMRYERIDLTQAISRWLTETLPASANY